MRILFPKQESLGIEEEKGDKLTLKKGNSKGMKNGKASRKNSSSNLNKLSKEKILKKVLKAEEKVRNSNWRPHSEFFSKFEELMRFFSMNTIEKKFYPVIETNLKVGNR